MPVVAKQGRLVLRPRTAAELMSPNPMSIQAEATVAEAVAVLTDRGYCAAPVIDEAGRPVGVLSRADLLVHDRERMTHHLVRKEDVPDGFELEETDPTLVADVMTPAVFSVTPDASAAEVVERMLGLKVHQLYVVDEGGALVGVISAMDVLRGLRPE
jgi:CBS-domain-containing membrane protein